MSAINREFSEEKIIGFGWCLGWINSLFIGHHCSMHLQYLQFNTYKKLRIFLRDKMVPIQAFTEQCSQVSNRVSKCFNFVLCLECHFNFISSLCSRASHSCSLDTCITEMFPNQFSLGTASLSSTRCSSIYTVHFLPVATSWSYFFRDRLFEFLQVKECSVPQKNH